MAFASPVHGRSKSNSNKANGCNRKIMPHDIAESVYCYLARDWGLAQDALTEGKCEQLQTSIPELRLAYQRNRAIAYHKPTVRRAYLAAFAPRYSYVLYRCLQ